MRSVLADKPVMDFQQPETVVSALIDPTTGFLAAPDCPIKQEEFYVEGTQPTEYCPKHGGENLKPLPPQFPGNN
jgi:membrane carboxypeptidase/penicillin-binding protein